MSEQEVTPNYYAVVEDGVVTNVIVATEDFIQSYRDSTGLTCVQYDEFDEDDTRVARIGEHYVDGKFITPYVAPSIPTSITMRQARLALLQAGKLSDIDTALAYLPSPQKEQAKIEWEYGSEVERHNGWIESLAPMLGMTDEDVDGLFVLGATL